MNSLKLLAGLLFLSCILLFPDTGFAQITSDADAKVPTEYSSGTQDDIHVFCGLKGEKNAALTANSVNGETSTFEWTKYNANTGVFDFYRSESGNISSAISDLEDGCYQVNISRGTESIIYTSWVFNNYYEATATIPQSDCDYFTLEGKFETPTFFYTDLTNGQAKELNKEIHVKWMVGETTISKFATTKVYYPPTKDTGYTFEVTDRFGCTANTEGWYVSIVTKASFEYKIEEQYVDPYKLEAPLIVSFTNTSENGDSGRSEWYIFKDLRKIKDEIAAGTFKDSIQDVVYNENVVYTFSEAGIYEVKLVTKKISEYSTCTDTFYIPEYIVIESAVTDAINVYTLDINGENDKFAVNPNPFTDKLSILVSEEIYGMKKVELFNMEGKLIWKQLVDVKNGQLEIDFSKENFIKSGLYLIRIIDGNDVVLNRKILKQP